MTQILRVYIHLVFAMGIQGLIFDKCTNHDQCPENAQCRPSGCEGYTCRCDKDYVSSDDKVQCLQVRLMGHSCDSQTNKCLSPFSICEENTCVCTDLLERSSDGRCKEPFSSTLKESCLDNYCVWNTECVGGTCVCAPPMRELSEEEYWLDPMNTSQCIPQNYSVHYCNGVKIPIPKDLLPKSAQNLPDTAIPSSTERSPVTTQLPEKKTAIVSLYSNQAKVFDRCSSHTQCPAHARCRPRGCRGYSCLCGEGYMATSDRKLCVPAVKVGEPCHPQNTSCISPFAYCSDVCRCLDVFVPTSDGRCKLPGISFYGEECGREECEYPSKCVDNKCQCVDEWRPLTSEEFWIDPSNIWQCRKDDASLGTCNGIIVPMPVDMTTSEPFTWKDLSTYIPTSSSPNTTEVIPDNGITTTPPMYTTNQDALSGNLITDHLTTSNTTSEPTKDKGSKVDGVNINIPTTTLFSTDFIDLLQDLTTPEPVTVTTETTTTVVNTAGETTVNESALSSTTTKVTTTNPTTKSTSTEIPTTQPETTQTTSTKTTTQEATTTQQPTTTTQTTSSSSTTTAIPTTQASTTGIPTTQSTTTEIPTTQSMTTFPTAESTTKESTTIKDPSPQDTTSTSIQMTTKELNTATEAITTLNGISSGSEAITTIAETSTPQMWDTGGAPPVDSNMEAKLSTKGDYYPKTTPFIPTTTRNNSIVGYLCEAHSFACSDRSCIPAAWLCDGNKNCPEGDDESTSVCNPSRVCGSDEFRCSTFRCISKAWLCDGDRDCRNGEDELVTNCELSKKSADQDLQTLTFETTITSFSKSKPTVILNTTNEIKIYVPAMATTPLYNHNNSASTTSHDISAIPTTPNEKGYKPNEIDPDPKLFSARLESFIIPAVIGLVFLVNLIGILLALTRRRKRKNKNKNPPSTESTTVAVSDDLESGEFKIPRPNVIFPPYYVKDDWNTWTSSHLKKYDDSLVFYNTIGGEERGLSNGNGNFQTGIPPYGTL